jgi:hypothetical protein
MVEGSFEQVRGHVAAAAGVDLALDRDGMEFIHGLLGQFGIDAAQLHDLRGDVFGLVIGEVLHNLRGGFGIHLHEDDGDLLDAAEFRGRCYLGAHAFTF